MPSKRYKKLPEKTKDLNAEVIEKLLADVKKNCTTKFDESLDLSFQINNKQKKSEINIRTVVNLPGGTGKKVKVAVVCEDPKSAEAKSAGADIVGGDDFIEKIKNGWTDVDKIVATPDMMGELGKLGKILGPKGLMPNPKSGTVTMDVGKAVNDLKAGQVELRVESNGIIHVTCGKSSFTKDQLVENIMKIYDTLIKARPASVKGQYFEKMAVSSTMGPSVLIDHLGIG